MANENEYKYLDLTGLTQYDTKIKEYFNNSKISSEEIQESCNAYLVDDGEAISDVVSYILNKPT